MRRRTTHTVAALVSIVAMCSAATAHAATLAEEPSGMPCNPCSVHVVGESHIEASTGVIVMECQDEFGGNLNSDGSGEVEWLGVSESGAGCNTQNCTVTPGEDDWETSGLEEEGPNEAHINVDYCFQAGPNQIECNANWHITEHDRSNHNYEVTLRHHQCAPGRFISGDWDLEAGIEILHRRAERAEGRTGRSPSGAVLLLRRPVQLPLRPLLDESDRKTTPRVS